MSKMEMRTMENLGIENSLLGFGCMRFPVTANGEIDEVLAEQMLTEAYEAGVTYFDTAYPYHGGKSEAFTGKVLKKFDRNTFTIATKLPIWMVKSEEDVRKYFEEQLARLDMDHVDFYLLHAMDKGRWEIAKKYKIIETCEELKKEGKIRFLGFSFHDAFEVFDEIIHGHDWDFCQIQYNYMDTNVQAGDAGYHMATDMGIPVVVMEPVRGGSLADFSEDINEVFHKINPGASIASFALRWVASHPNVKVILSGMSTLEQVQDNLNTFGNYKPFDDGEQKKMDEAVAIIRGRFQNACTRCRYCMPCPFGVDIPVNFRAWNEYHVFQSYDRVKRIWEGELNEDNKANNCTRCGTCLPLCPQHIQIPDDLEKVQADLDAAMNA